MKIHVLAAVIAAAPSLALAQGAPQAPASVQPPPPPAPVEYVAVADVLSRLKCDIFNAAAKAKGEQRSFTIDGEVSFNAEVVDGLSGTLGVGIEPSTVIPSIGIEGTAEREATRGQTITLGFDAVPAANNTGACTALAKVKAKGTGSQKTMPWANTPLFTYTPLTTMNVQQGGAIVTVKKVTYAGEYEVTKTGTAGGTLEIVVFKLGAEKSYARTAGQSFEVTLTFAEADGTRKGPPIFPKD